MPRSRLQRIVAITVVPVANIAEGEHLIELLACGHHGIDHGPTWSGTNAPLHQAPRDYQYHVGRRRRCRQCVAAAQR